MCLFLLVVVSVLFLVGLWLFLEHSTKEKLPHRHKLLGLFVFVVLLLFVSLFLKVYV